MDNENYCYYLNKYFEDEVKLKRDQRKTVVQTVIPVLEQILKRIHELDPRFGRFSDAFHAGSYYQGLKVKRADEFDFTIPLVKVGRLVWSSSTHQRYYQFNRPVPEQHNTVSDDLEIVRSITPLPSPPTGNSFLTLSPSGPIAKEHSDLMFDNDLVSFLVRRSFKRCVSQAIRELDLRDMVRMSKLYHGPAVTLTITSNEIPYDVSVDMAPMIESRLPFPTRINWPRLGRNWPSSEKIKEIRSLGINLVAKKDFYWNLSFVECEKELMKEIDSDGGIRKKCHRIMKSFRENVWCPKGMKQVLSSFHLKNVLFWECEAFPLSSDWQEDKLAVRFVGMSRKLIQYLRDRQLPLYFYPAVNLFLGKELENLDQVASRIEDFLTQPERYRL